MGHARNSRLANTRSYQTDRRHRDLHTYKNVLDIVFNPADIEVLDRYDWYENFDVVYAVGYETLIDSIAENEGVPLDDYHAVATLSHGKVIVAFIRKDRLEDSDDSE